VTRAASGRAGLRERRRPGEEKKGMTRKEIHDIANIVAPSMSLAQNLLLGFHGKLAKDQRDVVKKIDICLKELQAYLQHRAESEVGT
jgi:hypothetical protein